MHGPVITTLASIYDPLKVEQTADVEVGDLSLRRRFGARTITTLAPWMTVGKQLKEAGGFSIVDH